MSNSEKLTPERKQFLRKWVVLLSAFESLLETAIKLVAALFTGSAGMQSDRIHVMMPLTPSSSITDTSCLGANEPSYRPMKAASKSMMFLESRLISPRLTTIDFLIPSYL